MLGLEPFFKTLDVDVSINYNGQYCGKWAVDTSGTHYINFHIVSHGECYLSMPGQETSPTALKQGDMVIFPRDSQHCIVSGTDLDVEINTAQMLNYEDGIKEDATGLVCGHICHDHPIINDITRNLPDVITIHNSDNQNETLYALIRSLVVEAKKTGAAANFVLTKIAEAVMALLFKEHLAGEDGVLSALLHPKIGKAVQAIQGMPEHKWTVEGLAQICHMSRTAFSELFRDICGMSPMEFVTFWRLSLAYSWLAEGQRSTLDVALAIGYDNESSFSKAFKRVLGVSPGAVRKRSKVNQQVS